MATSSVPQPLTPEQLAKSAQERLEEKRENVEKYQEKLMTRFADYALATAILPPRAEDKEKIAVLTLIDDMNSSKTPKADLREKILKVLEEMAKEVDENILPEPLLLSELWQYCYDGKYEVLGDLALSAIVYDVGMLSALKLAEIHKQMVMQKFEKYIVAYVLGGSLVQGTATTKSDVDVFIIIDDTDVKKMTRAELRDKLRAIIIDLGFQAGEITGVKNKINIQPYLLTDFWDWMKEANPVIFTFLRDGVPFFDRGIFMPWKQLLEMGKVKPSQEAIELFMSSGDQYLKRVKVKLREMGIEDFFWATITPSQAALMMYGHPPPTPKELANVLRDIFVVKEKFLEEKDVKTIEHILKVRKDMEHQEKLDISGKEIDELYEKSQAYLLKMNELFDKIQQMRDEESVLQTYENTITLVRDVLKQEGHNPKDKDLLKTFENELVAAGHIPEKFIRVLRDIEKAKKDYDAKKLSKAEVHEVNKKGREFFKYMLEFLQRRRGQELDRAKIRVKHGDTFGEVILLEDQAFIIHDLQAPEKMYSKAKVKKNGSLSALENATLEEVDLALAEASIPESVFIHEPIFEDIKKIFGKEVQILLTR